MEVKPLPLSSNKLLRTAKFVFASSSKCTIAEQSCLMALVRSFSFAYNMKKSSRKSTMAVLSKFSTFLGLLNILPAGETATGAVAANFLRRFACLS